MPVYGNNAKPGYSYHAYGGSGQINQECEALVLPDQRIRILSLGQWVGGWGGTCRVRLTLWDSASFEILGQTAEISVASIGTPGDNKAALYTAALETPYEADAGQTVLVGFTRHRDDAHNVITGNSPNGHRHGRGTYPSSDFGIIEYDASVTKRIGAWIEDYEPVANVKVYRSGVWTDGVPKVYRSGVWTDATGIKVYRSGVWVDAD